MRYDAVTVARESQSKLSKETLEARKRQEALAGREAGRQAGSDEET